MMRETSFPVQGSNASDIPGSGKFDTAAFAERFSTAMDMAGGKSRVSDQSGASLSALYRYANAEASPSISLTETVASMANVRLDWLVSGKGDMKLAGDSQMGEAFFPVPRINVEASAGAGRVGTETEVLETLAFRASWLRDRFGDPEKLEVVSVRGDSQEPELFDGDVGLVHRGMTDIGEGLYVVGVDDLVMIKRLQLVRPGHLQLKSANPVYDPISIDLKVDADSFRVIGRLVWAGRTLI